MLVIMDRNVRKRVEAVKETIAADSMVTVLYMVAYQDGKVENVIRVS